MRAVGVARAETPRGIRNLRSLEYSATIRRMAYTRKNFRTKKELLQSLEAGERIEVYQPRSSEPLPDGEIGIEGPHAPEHHDWYAHVAVTNGAIVKILK